MSDYISREAAMEIVKRTSGDYAAAFSEIRKLPAADVEPERNGRWEEREKVVVQLRKQWQAAEMFICTMCGHFDYDIDGDIVCGNRACCEIVGYPCCKKFTPWIPCSERPPKELEPVNVVWVNHRPEPYYGKIKDVPQKATAVYYREKWYWWSCVCEDLLAEYGRNEMDHVDDDIEITHWLPMPEPPKVGGTEK